MKFGILKNEFDDNHIYWSNSCKKFGIEYEIIDMLSHKWLDEIKAQQFDAFLSCPPGRETLYKTMYDEKVYVINKTLKKLVYPSYDEISIHENKKYLSYWMNAVGLPFQGTYVFYHKDEAIAFAKHCKYPIVSKINIGASGQGVKIHSDKDSLLKYIEKGFGEGLTQRWGPNLKMGSYGDRILGLVKNPSRIKKRLTVYKKTKNEIQKGFVILQDFVPHTYEWRVAKIGDSYFGHQKVKQGDKASGTKGINYIAPPEKLLDFVKELCHNHGFNSMAVDVFEDGKGGYFINELQTIFGHVQEYICEKDGSPGRFKYIDDQWIFEEGLFNSNLSYDLRIENIIEIVNKKN